VAAPLKFTSCQAPSADPVCAAIVGLIGHRLGLGTEFVEDVTWKERERRFDRGEIDVCWMCGWPYAERADSAPAALDLIGAQVMADSRYGRKPIYFSDIVVRADSHYRSFDDLRGVFWAYNEPKSHSGYNAVRYFLAQHKTDGSYFGSVLESGSHAASIGLILDGKVDAAAVDSTVLEAIRRQRPEAVARLRVIGVIGPSPAPPWVMRSSLAPDLRDVLRKEFLAIHESAAGRAILDRAAVSRIGAVSDLDYSPIREMAAVAARIRL
jgi:phosphonate transport system substrate-binding protein